MSLTSSKSSAVTISKKIRDKLCNVSDKGCAIFSFLNEEDELKIGFQAWIQNKKLLTEWIEEEVKIYWPVDCPITPAERIAKKLASAAFQEHMVVIKAVGEWTEMKAQMKLFEKSGALNVSKGSRKTISKKYEESPTKPERRSKAPKSGSSKVVANEILSKNSKASASTLKVWEGARNSEAESDGAESDKQSEHDSVRPVVLLSRKSCSGSSESLPKPPEMNDDFEKDLSGARGLGPIVKPSTSSGRTSGSGKRNKYDIENNGSNESSEDDDPVNKLKKKKFHLQSPVFGHRKNPNDCKRFKYDDAFSDRTNYTTSDSENLPDGIKMRPPLPKSVIQNLPTSSKRAYIGAIVENLCTKQYLTAHSPTGGAVNSNRGYTIRPAIDQFIFYYIKHLVGKKYGTHKEIMSEMRKVISDKISAARSAVKGSKGALEETQKE